MCIKWNSSFLGFTTTQTQSGNAAQSFYSNSAQSKLVVSSLLPIFSMRNPSEFGILVSHSSVFIPSRRGCAHLAQVCIWKKEKTWLIHRVISYESSTPSHVCADTQLFIFSCMLDSSRATFHESWQGDDCHITWFASFETKDYASQILHPYHVKYEKLIVFWFFFLFPNQSNKAIITDSFTKTSWTHLLIDIY